MKHFHLSAFVFSFCTTAAFAGTLTCLANEVSRPQGWPSDLVRLKIDSANAGGEEVSKIESVLKIPNRDDTFSDEVEVLYSRTESEPLIRGGVRALFCTLDTNEVSEKSEQIKIASECALGDNTDSIMFRVVKNADGTGYVATDKFVAYGNDTRRIELTKCQLESTESAI